RPSSHTGRAGLKPAQGRLPRRDSLPVILHECEVVGPIARTMADIDLAMQLMSIADVRDPLSQRYAGKADQPVASPESCRILYVGTFSNQPVDPEVAEIVAQAANHLAQLGHHAEHCPNLTIADPINDVVWPVIGETGLAWLLERYP